MRKTAIKVSYIQYDVSHDWEQNMETAERLLKTVSCDIAVFPELCSCGYLFENREDLLRAAERIPDGKSVARMKQLSELYGCSLVFGMAEAEGDKIYNTAVLVSKGNYVGKYRKIHLSDFEKKLFDRGNSNAVFEAEGIKIGIQICFDLWFPEVSREQVRQGADLLCVLANFGGETTYQISKIRAIENLTPVVLCNRVGHEQLPEIDAEFLGKSSVIDSCGNRLLAGKAGSENAEVCEIQIQAEKSNVICRNFDAEIALHYLE